MQTASRMRARQRIVRARQRHRFGGTSSIAFWRRWPVLLRSRQQSFLEAAYCTVEAVSGSSDGGASKRRQDQSTRRTAITSHLQPHQPTYDNSAIDGWLLRNIGSSLGSRHHPNKLHNPGSIVAGSGSQPQRPCTASGRCSGHSNTQVRHHL